MRKFDYEGLEERGEAHPATTEVRHKATNLKNGLLFQVNFKYHIELHVFT